MEGKVDSLSRFEFKRPKPPLIGVLLVNAGRLAKDDVPRVLTYQKAKRKRFGESAVEMGLVSVDDMQFALALQFNCTYALKGKQSLSLELVAAYEPFGDAVEQLRILRSQLLIRWMSPRDQSTLAVTSLSTGDGRSYVAANLAIVFSQLGERTLLVDADMRNPRQHQLFNVDNSTGLSTILSERTGMESLHRIDPFANLSVLTAGPSPPNPQDLLSRHGFATFVQLVRGAFDVVIVDTPPAASFTDAQIVASQLKGVLFLARAGHTPVDKANALLKEFSGAGAVIAGAVLNHA